MLLFSYKMAFGTFLYKAKSDSRRTRHTRLKKLLEVFYEKKYWRQDVIKTTGSSKRFTSVFLLILKRRRKSTVLIGPNRPENPRLVNIAGGMLRIRWRRYFHRRAPVSKAYLNKGWWVFGHLKRHACLEGSYRQSTNLSFAELPYGHTRKSGG